MLEFFEELWDEAVDFFEDLWNHFKKQPKEGLKTRTAVINGVQVTVRPAYLFAERVDNLLRIIFGFSVAISAFTATFLGFVSLSQLTEALTSSVLGRVAMFIIGISYLIIAFWKLLHLSKKL
jgi:hypothetical protein